MNPAIKRRNVIPALVLAVALTPVVSTAEAQVSEAADSKGNGAALDEIIVTAQKRAERLQDVPMSIAAITGDTLQKQGITDTSQLTRVVPGFTYHESNFGTPVYTMRGVGR